MIQYEECASVPQALAEVCQGEANSEMSTRLLHESEPDHGMQSLLRVGRTHDSRQNAPSREDRRHVPLTPPTDTSGRLLPRPAALKGRVEGAGSQSSALSYPFLLDSHGAPHRSPLVINYSFKEILQCI